MSYLPTLLILSLLYKTTSTRNVFLPTIECYKSDPGDPDKIDCEGTITGFNTEKLLCHENNCEETQFIINAPQKFEFEARQNSFINGNINATNVTSMKCLGINSCKNSIFNMLGTPKDGFDITCDGAVSCQGIAGILTYPEKIDCIGGINSCSDSRWIISTPYKEEFKVNCVELNSCSSTSWTYNIAGSQVIEYKFDGTQSGNNVEIKVQPSMGEFFPNADIVLHCDLGDGDTQSCNNIQISTVGNVIVTCEALCKPGACGSISGCIITESFLNKNNQKKLILNKQTIIIIIMVSIISILLVISIIIGLYLWKQKIKMKQDINEVVNMVEHFDKQKQRNINLESENIVATTVPENMTSQIN